MEELHELYAANCDNQEASLSAPLPFRDYIAYTLQQDESLAANYWHEMLAGVTQPTVLEAKGEGVGQGHAVQSLSVEATTDLNKLVQQQRLTISSVLQGALALLISRYAAMNSIVYGVTVSGRPPDLPGVSGMLGSFINNLPFYVDCSPDLKLIDWLQLIQESQQSMQAFQQYSPFKIQGWSSIVKNKPLFELLFLYQAPFSEHKETFNIKQVEDGLQTNYPLTLVSELTPEGELQIDVFFDKKRFNSPYINQLLSDWISLTTAILSDASQPLGHYRMLIDPPKRAIDHDKPISIKSLAPEELPRDEIQSELVAIWQELLEDQFVGINDDFFEIGGSSLLAMHMFSRIADDMEVKLPLSVLFTNTTIEQLAACIDSQKGTVEDWSLLVPIQVDGEKPPFFCVHGLTGDILWFRQLGQLLAPDQPFYGIQAQGLDGETNSIDSINEMAAIYIDEMMSVQKNGPYYLGGASLGGTVALEMAQQLEQNGEQVAILVMFDHAPDYPQEINGRFGQWFTGSMQIVSNFPYWVSSMRDLGNDVIMQRVRRKLRNFMKLFNSKTSEDMVDGVEAADLLDYGSQLPEYRKQMIEAHWHAINQYSAEPYDKRVLLLQAKSQPLLSTELPEATWKNLARGELTIITVPGSHEGMFHDPHVDTLAQELRAQLELAQGTFKNHD
jgi:thioesterase domain-containing protein